RLFAHIPPRDKSQLATIQEGTASKIGAEVRAAIGELKIPQLPEIPKFPEIPRLELEPLADRIGASMHQELEQLVPRLDRVGDEISAMRAWFNEQASKAEQRAEAEIAAAKGQLGGLVKGERAVAGEFAIAALQDSLGPIWMLLEAR